MSLTLSLGDIFLHTISYFRINW